MSESIEDSLEQPRNRFHDLMNAIHASATATALIRKELEHQGIGIGRVEIGITGLLQKVESLSEKVGRIESDVNHKIAGLETKVELLEERFEPVRKAMYWLIAIVVGGVVTAMLALILHR